MLKNLITTAIYTLLIVSLFTLYANSALGFVPYKVQSQAAVWMYLKACMHDYNATKFEEVRSNHNNTIPE